MRRKRKRHRVSTYQHFNIPFQHINIVPVTCDASSLEVRRVTHLRLLFVYQHHPSVNKNGQAIYLSASACRKSIIKYMSSWFPRLPLVKGSRATRCQRKLTEELHKLIDRREKPSYYLKTDRRYTCPLTDPSGSLFLLFKQLRKQILEEEACMLERQLDG